MTKEVFKPLAGLKIILASKSPRRQFLLNELGLNFEIKTKDVPEDFPAELKQQEIPIYLCELKAKAFVDELSNDNIVITADTIVWVDNQVLNKPETRDEAIKMLKLLSGKKHEVYTGVCLLTKHKMKSFYVRTDVFFKTLSNEEIEFYVNTYQPYDKAGAYGAQEWIGYVGVERIEGSYFNVMGLPVKELYEELIKINNH